MAIIIEEKTTQNGIVTFLVWLAILAIVAASVYYVFFKKPQLVEFTAAPSFSNVQQLSKISISSDQLINSKQFQALKQYVEVTPPESAGRSNPFLSY